MNESHALNPDVSVVTVNYNGLCFLENFLNSLKTAFNHYTFETIILDNASSDGSQAFLRNREDIFYIESPENLGFTGGNNRAVTKASGKVVLLLNNDTRVESCLDPLIDMALKEDVGAVGCRLIYGDGRLQFSAGLEHSPLRMVLSWFGFEKQHWFPSVFRRVQTNPAFYDVSHSEVDWVSGACLATRREVWKTLKGLDEMFFMYCEDVDYCHRVRKLNKKVVYLSNATVTHFEGAGKPWIGRMALMRTVNSYRVYFSKYYSPLAFKITQFSLSAVFFARAGAFFAKSFISNDQVKTISKDKFSAYGEAAFKLLQNSMKYKNFNL